MHVYVDHNGNIIKKEEIQEEIIASDNTFTGKKSYKKMQKLIKPDDAEPGFTSSTSKSSRMPFRTRPFTSQTDKNPSRFTSFQGHHSTTSSRKPPPPDEIIKRLRKQQLAKPKSNLLQLEWKDGLQEDDETKDIYIGDDVERSETTTESANEMVESRNIDQCKQQSSSQSNNESTTTERIRKSLKQIVLSTATELSPGNQQYINFDEKFIG